MKAMKLVSRVEASDEYKNWRESNPKFYLSSIFTILEAPEQEWHLNYYDADKDMIDSFILGQGIRFVTHSEILSEETPIALEPEKAIIPFDEILSIAKDFMNKNYPNFKPQRTMVVLQVYGGLQVWNISFFSALMMSVNMKIDASNGNIVSHKPLSIIHFEDTKKE